MFVGAKDMHYTTSRRPPGARRHGRPVVRQCRPLPPADHRGDPASRRPSSTTRRPSRWATPRPSSWPTGWSTSRPRAWTMCSSPTPAPKSVDTALKIAHRLSPRARRGLALPPDRPRARLSRRQFRRHLGRRHRHQPQDVRHAADRRRPHAATPTSPTRTPSRAASPNTAPSSPTSSSASSRCTTPRPSPPSSSSRSPARPACCSRRRAIWSGCARSATSTASC